MQIWLAPLHCQIRQVSDVNLRENFKSANIIFRGLLLTLIPTIFEVMATGDYWWSMESCLPATQLPKYSFSLAGLSPSASFFIKAIIFVNFRGSSSS